MKYPCNCADMQWLVDNNDVFINRENHWMMKWTEFDRVGIKNNIQVFAIRIYYCVFCGKKINQEAQ